MFGDDRSGDSALVAERREKANQAYSDASYLRNAATGMFVFLAGPRLYVRIHWIPRNFVISVVLLVRWQLRFGDLLTNDPITGGQNVRET